MAEHIKSPKGDVVLVLSAGEARGLLALVEEGRDGGLCGVYCCSRIDRLEYHRIAPPNAGDQFAQIKRR